MPNASSSCFRLTLIITVWVALTPLAQANILGPGQTMPPDAFSNHTFTVLVVETKTLTAPTFSALVTTAVFSDPTNPFCTSCLDFVTTLINNGPDAIERLSTGSFTGWMTDVGYIVPGAGTLPNSVDRSGSGSVIAFNFSGGNEIPPHQGSPFLVIKTNAPCCNFGPGFLSLEGDTMASGTAFQPVPEPSSLALLGAGLVPVIGVIRRRYLNR